jgi:hypothetical protein
MINPRMIQRLIAAGTVLTNTTTHTVLDAFVAPANFWTPGKVVNWTGLARAIATNSTDTLRVRGLFGPTTLTGTAIFDGTAVDVADNDVIAWNLWLTCRTSSTLIVHGSASIEGASGTVTQRSVYASVTSLDFTVAQRCELTGLWSVAAAGNSAQAEQSIFIEYA